MSASAPKRRLVEGNKLRCPHCGELGDPLYSFQPLEMSEEFKDELYLVQKHRRDRGGCGHVFAPGEPLIIAAYLSGVLIPRTALEEANKTIVELREQLSEAKAIEKLADRREGSHA